MMQDQDKTFDEIMVLAMYMVDALAMNPQWRENDEVNWQACGTDALIHFDNLYSVEDINKAIQFIYAAANMAEQDEIDPDEYRIPPGTTIH